MNSVNNLWEEFISYDNIETAILAACKSKTKRYDVQNVLDQFYLNKDITISNIQDILLNGWVHKPYKHKVICEKDKVRNIFVAKFYPDRIIHHAINQILEKVFIPTLINDTYQSLKGRGSHKAIIKLSNHVKYSKPDEYALKVDISKFYPSVDNDLLIDKIKRKIRDTKFISVVSILINSHKGLPIGNYTSQLLGNIFLSDLDHLIKSMNKRYLRYADDLVVLGSKQELQQILSKIRQYVDDNKLKLNPSTQLFPLMKRTLEFLGFRYYKSYIRPKKKTIVRTLTNLPKMDDKQKASVFGWVKIGKSNKLIYKIYVGRINILSNVLPHVLPNLPKFVRVFLTSLKPPLNKPIKRSNR